MNRFKNIELKQWKIQSSHKISASGKTLSTDLNSSKDWINAQVPSTVLGTLVANNVYENPYYAENLKRIPTDIFTVPWWYTTTFEISDEHQFGSVEFEGINYKANVWLNGELIANPKDIDGAYRITSFDISKHLVKGNNHLAIEVIPPKPGDFSTGFVDWNPSPPDGNMGIFRPVSVMLHSGVLIKNTFVETSFKNNNYDKAYLSISAELYNVTASPIVGTVVGCIDEISFAQEINIDAFSEKKVTFAPNDFSQLEIENPKLWWPVQLGEPDMYELDLQFELEGMISSKDQVNFGIREVKDYWLNDIHRGFIVNGKKVLIKGAGWTDDLLLQDNDESIETQVKYVKQMNLNCIRLEGIWGKDHKLYDLCDAHGILLMVGWSCHWEHEIHMGVPVDERFGGVYKPEDIAHVSQAWEDQVKWLRNHPSIFVWTVASDKVPITELEERYIETFKKYDSTRPYLNSTGGVGSDQHVIGSEDVISEISGSSGVKMLGPYAYTAPHYWFTDTNFGGAYGFNTETGPGAQVPQIESLKKFIPKEKLWPISEVWNYHCGRYEFADLSRFIQAIDSRYGKPESLEEFDKKAQAMNYELMRPMFEAFQVNKKKATGVIQWMLNAAWPKMYWQLYDYYLMPTGAFYATQKACMPLHIMYDYGNQQIFVVNDYHKEVANLKAEIRVLDIHSKLILEQSVMLNAESDSSNLVYEIKELKDITTTYFLDLRLYDDQLNTLSNNFYWLSTQNEILDYEADLGEFAFHTPSKQYADFTLLNTLPNAGLNVHYEIEKYADHQEITVSMVNTSEVIAFLINLKLLNKHSKEIVIPVFWEDNFISLLPHEKRTLKATFGLDIDAELKIEGWNIKN